MNQYKILLIALLGCFLVACEKQLELSPAQSIAGDVAIKSESGIENILIGTYDEAGQGATYGGSLQVIADLIGNNDQVSWGGTFLAPAEIVNRAILPDNGFVGGFWNNAYETINQANIVIDNATTVTSSDEKRGNVEGQAKFLRALNYFDLVSHFSSGGTGVPLRTNGILDYGVELSIARASVSDINNLIVQDLSAAATILPDVNDVFADRFSAAALLARVQLYNGNYAEARDAANNVINSSGHSLASTFAGAFNNDADGPEDLFSFQVTSQTGTNSLITYYATEANGGRGGDISINDEYVAIFDDPNDQRASFFDPDAPVRLTAKYTNQFANIPLIRLAEMHLIRAEANMRLGTSTGATPLEDINALRARSGAAALGSVTLEDILLERQRELAFEGFFIHDAKRTQSMVGGLNYDDPKLVLPIPQAEMDTNPLMEQNPSY